MQNTEKFDAHNAQKPQSKILFYFYYIFSFSLEVNKKDNQNVPIVIWLKAAIFDFTSTIVRSTIAWLLYIMQIFLQLLLIIIAVLGVLHVVWNYAIKSFILLLICRSLVGNLPYISDHCELLSKTNDGNSTMVSLPVNSFLEKTVELAERLSDTDVSATVKLTEVKISLIDLKVNVMYSELNQLTKDQLQKQIGTIKDSVQSATNGMHKMLASFKSALTKMEIYTNNLFKHLTNTKYIASESQSKTTTFRQNEIQQQFVNYLEDIEKEIERVIFNAESVDSIFSMFFFVRLR
jgi:hypothetical protein